ncbi:MAG: hypothetical protein JST16_03845 [Bdellovibrionales bacterium]|nr:hypothetical protein [Bdellovibrionales bacterium]
MMSRIVCVWVLGVGMAGCSSMGESVGVGVGSGAAAGAVFGAASASRNRGEGALIGAGVGALVGGVTSYFIHKGLESRDASTRKETLFGLERFGVSSIPKNNSTVPSVSFQVMEEQKIETHRQGNKIIEGHRIWVLSDDSGVLLSPQEANSKTKK